MDLLTTIRQLYDSEITCGLETWYDSGIIVWIGDSHNGHLAQEHFTWSDVERIPAWLDAEARRIYPDSRYANGRHGADPSSSRQAD